MYVIAGVTGNTGSIVAQTLLDKGLPVRVIVRSAEEGAPWKNKGAQVAVADLMDSKALAEALSDALGAYFLLPPELDHKDFLGQSRKRADAIVDAAKTAALPHATILSSVGAQFTEQVGPISTVAYLEELFIQASIPLSAIRPGYFLENIDAMMPVVSEQGVYPSMILPLDFKIDMVATHDIGQAVAAALLDPPSVPHRVVELKGAAKYSADDIAAELSRALGRDITAVAIPRDAWEGQMMDAGLSEQSAATLAQMYDNVNNGRIDFLDHDARKAATDLETYVTQMVA